MISARLSHATYWISKYGLPTYMRPPAPRLLSRRFNMCTAVSAQYGLCFECIQWLYGASSLTLFYFHNRPMFSKKKWQLNLPLLCTAFCYVGNQLCLISTWRWLYHMGQELIWVRRSGKRSGVSLRRYPGSVGVQTRMNLTSNFGKSFDQLGM